jgi:hypothetical protein
MVCRVAFLKREIIGRKKVCKLNLEYLFCHVRSDPAIQEAVLLTRIHLIQIRIVENLQLQYVLDFY